MRPTIARASTTAAIILNHSDAVVVVRRRHRAANAGPALIDDDDLGWPGVAGRERGQAVSELGIPAHGRHDNADVKAIGGHARDSNAGVTAR